MFEAGKEVVALRNHPDGAYTKGTIFMVRDIQKPYCNCMLCLIDIGFRSNGGDLLCVFCNKKFKNHTKTWWFGTHNFAPIDSIQAEMILKEVELVEINS